MDLLPSMSATFMLSHHLLLPSKSFNLPHICNFFTDSSIPLSLSISLRNHKHVQSTFSSTSNSTTTAVDNDHESSNKYQQTSPPWIKATDYSEHETLLPWVRAPITSESIKDKKKFSNDGDGLTGRVSGGRGRKTMKRVFEGIEKLAEKRNLDEKQKNLALVQKSVGYDFRLEEFENEVDSRFGGKLPWKRDERMIFRRTKKEKKVTQAELKLDPDLLDRLRNEASKMRKWVKVKKLGVTEAVRDQIFSIWKNNELAMLKFDIPLCRNMDRAAEIVEIKTGGLVVWCKKDELVVYRGCNCPSTSIPYSRSQLVKPIKSSQSTIFDEESAVAVTGSLFEREADRLLDGLGPRFVDWWYHKPLPVDADLLAESVPGYKPPFRLCPPGSIKYRQDKLNDNELTHLRNLARPLPTHFVLGRNRKLQGLAVAILKLWEKCHIAKIAVKLGVPNTDNEQMANELKVLTGGDLLLRNKYYLVLYRGKDFLPCDVANLVAERETELYTFQIEEESARRSSIQYETDESSSAATGTLLEFKEIVREGVEIGNREAEIEKQKLEIELKKQEHKLFILKKKIKRTGRELAKLNSWWIPSENNDDRELITYEEKECFRKIALKMDNCLVLGRRGVFDGVIEGIHQHWKHKEIVKVITMQRAFSQIIYTANLLEAETGGVLVSVNKLKEGYAIILYRGKNYRRPLKLAPQNLLNKQDALLRSIDLQRIGSLKFFVRQRETSIYELKRKLEEVEEKMKQ